MVLISYGTYINSCFEWESAQRSIVSFVLFVAVVCNFELYMLPPLCCCCSSGTTSSPQAEKQLTLRRPCLTGKMRKRTKRTRSRSPRASWVNCTPSRTCSSAAQSALDDVASYGERIKNTGNWTGPFLSWLAIAALCSATVLLYLVPLRYLVLAWGVKKFTKKLRDPYMIDNNELLDFLSRVPSDVQVRLTDHT
ncbi:multiple C2 and transmembrane domain-containing protein 1-like isoform X2 [Sander vitreus]